MSENIRQAIQAGKTALGIELGSTRIKAVLIGEDHSPIASGSFDWENRLENGVWTYHMDEVWQGIQGCYRAMKEDVQAKYGVTLKGIGAIGMSAMMHGYLPFSQEGKQLAAFRTWRNTITAKPPRSSPSCSASTFPSAGASPTCTRPSSTARST